MNLGEPVQLFRDASPRVSWVIPHFKMNLAPSMLSMHGGISLSIFRRQHGSR
jgi:hypothetical protein